MMTDPLADMLTRIRNAVRIEKPAVEMPASGAARTHWTAMSFSTYEPCVNQLP